MSKLFTLSLLSFAFLLQVHGQGNVQASLGRGSAANRVKIYIKSDITETANISTLEFNIAVPDSVSAGTPTVVSSASSVVWQVQPATSEGGYKNFAIVTAQSPITYSLTSGAEFEVMELQFSDYSSTLPSFVSLVTLPDGGSSGLLLFYSTGSPQSNGSSLYYSRGNDNGYSTTIDNEFSYDITGATSGTTTSYARLVSTPTPVTLASFNATASNNTALLSWTVENQDGNTGQFDIERSSNGTDFSQLSMVQATNQPSGSYSFTDNSSYLSGLVYYRLKIVDKNGQVAYSDIKPLQFGLKPFAISLYPNPVQNLTRLDVTLDRPLAIDVIVNDAVGKTVRHLQISGQKGINQQTIDLSALPTGTYMVRVQADQQVKTIPVIKN